MRDSAFILFLSNKVYIKDVLVFLAVIQLEIFFYLFPLYNIGMN